MKKILRSILLLFAAFVKKAVILKNKIEDIREEQRIDKKVCEKHKGEWTELNREELKKFRREKYTYTIYKNLSDDFDKYSDYFVTSYRGASEILTRVSPENHTVDGRPFDTIFNDKNYFERFFPDVVFPKAIIRCINGNYFDKDYQPISREEALQQLSTYSDVVFKKSLDTQHGGGILPANGDKIKEVFEQFGKNFIVQELIKQHSFFSDFNSSSVNAVRITTVFWKGNSYFLDARLRIGAPGSFCDHKDFGDKNALQLAVDENGNLNGKIVDCTDFAIAPDVFGKKAAGTIPAFRQMLEMAVRGQSLYPNYGILGWDFTVAEDGSLVCIEVNSKYPGIRSGQCINGPIFMKKTVDGNYLLDEILSEPLKSKGLKIL